MQPDGTQPDRGRLSKRGARQERAKQQEYATKLARWQHVERVLVHAEHLVLGLGAQGERRPADPALPLQPGERVLAVLPALVLVEVSRPAGVPRPEYARYSARVAASLAFRRASLPAEPQRVRGHGAVTVTNQRIVFHGTAGITEWPYERITLVEHAIGRPVSLLHLAGEQAVFGLLSRPRDAARVRLLLEYGMAARTGEVHRLLVGLSVEHRLHALDHPAAGQQPTDRPGPRLPAGAASTRAPGPAPGPAPAPQRPGWDGRVIRAARTPIEEPARQLLCPRRRLTGTLRAALPALRTAPRRAVFGTLGLLGIALLAVSGTTQNVLAAARHAHTHSSSPASQPAALAVPAAGAGVATQEAAATTPVTDPATPATDPPATAADAAAQVTDQALPRATSVISAAPTTTPARQRDNTGPPRTSPAGAATTPSPRVPLTPASRAHPGRSRVLPLR